MTAPVLALTLLSLTGGGIVAAADSPQVSIPAVDAGSVATVVVHGPADPDVRSLRYRLRMADGFRPLLPAAGEVAVVGDILVVAVSFQTPAVLPPGETRAGALVLTGAGRDRTVPLRIRVRERRSLALAVDTEALEVSPGGAAAVGYRIHNRGNVADTVLVTVSGMDGWVVSRVPPVVLEPGETRAATLEIASPLTAQPGTMATLMVSARNGVETRSQPVRLAVVTAAGPVSGLAHVPSRLFVGHALDDGGGGPVVALSGRGKVARDTEVRFDLQHRDGSIPDPAFQRHLGGPRARLEVERPGLLVAAGEVQGLRSAVTGGQRRGRGVRIEYDPGSRLSATVVAAVPVAVGPSTGNRRLLHFDAGAHTGIGRFGVSAGHTAEGSFGEWAGYRSDGVGVGWTHVHARHSARLEGGLRRLRVDGEPERAGPMVDAEYAYRGQPVRGRLRFRSTPGAAASGWDAGDELSGTIAADLRRGLQVVGWGQETRRDLVARRMVDRTRAGTLGLLHSTGRLQLQVGGAYREQTTERSEGTHRTGRRVLRGDVAYGRGAWTIQTDVEAGTADELGQAGAYRSVGLGGRWSHREGGGWVKVERTRRPGTLTPTTTLQLGGSGTRGRVGFATGASTIFMADHVSTSFWSALEVDVQRHTSLHFGLSGRPALGRHDLTLSVGASRRLSLPLPVPRRPDVRGLVFHDLNGNGRPDPGEPPIEGVRVTLGHLRTTTDEAGVFAFHDAPHGVPAVHAAELPGGYVPLPGVSPADRGRLAVPLIRSASVDLALFLDRNGDGRRGPGEEPAAGAVVTLTDDGGAQRTVAADGAGRARVAGLVPGRYRITARAAGDRTAASEPPVLLELTLVPGEAAAAAVGVPPRSREIRMGGAEAFDELFR